MFTVFITIGWGFLDTANMARKLCVSQRVPFSAFDSFLLMVFFPCLRYTR